ncbi:hypothetical protein V8C40DRAFT_248292 [Trichoderma camerunense]
MIRWARRVLQDATVGEGTCIMYGLSVYVRARACVCEFKPSGGFYCRHGFISLHLLRRRRTDRQNCILHSAFFENTKWHGLRQQPLSDKTTKLPFEVLAGVLYWLPGPDPSRFPQIVPAGDQGDPLNHQNVVWN